MERHLKRKQGSASGCEQLTRSRSAVPRENLLLAATFGSRWANSHTGLAQTSRPIWLFAQHPSKRMAVVARFCKTNKRINTVLLFHKK